MNNTVYIDGNLLVKSCIFHSLNFIMYADEKCRDICDEIIPCNENGVYEVVENSGSMFKTYYIKGGITMYGENGGNIKCFKKEHEQTYAKYKEMLSKILQLLEEAVVPKGCENYFYMQQYVSLFANLEYFLYGTLMWETCQCYERYKKVMLLLKGYVRNKDIKSILNGEYSILQEITLVEQIKYVIYHKTKQVQELYKVTFDIDLDLDVLKKQIEIRHDIVHRMGYTKDDSLIQITKEDVISLTNKIVGLVDGITSKIKEVN